MRTFGPVPRGLCDPRFRRRANVGEGVGRDEPGVPRERLLAGLERLLRAERQERLLGERVLVVLQELELPVPVLVCGGEAGDGLVVVVLGVGVSRAVAMELGVVCLSSARPTHTLVGAGTHDVDLCDPALFRWVPVLPRGEIRRVLAPAPLHLLREA